MTDAHVRLWGRNIGAISWLDDRQIGVFQYEPDFLASGIQLAPVTMPLSANPYEFPNLPRDAFKGLPGLLADSLPDKFGNALIIDEESIQRIYTIMRHELDFSAPNKRLASRGD